MKDVINVERFLFWRLIDGKIEKEGRGGEGLILSGKLMKFEKGDCVGYIDKDCKNLGFFSCDWKVFSFFLCLVIVYIFNGRFFS